MARFAVGVVFGIVVGSTLGAALAIHASDADGHLVSAATDEESDAPDVVAEPEPTLEPIPSVWLRLAQCESTGNWGINTGNGYYGGLQEDLSFWRNHGGLAYASRPDLASPAAQIAVAERGLAVQGWGAWPACSRRLGLR